MKAAPLWKHDYGASHRGALLLSPLVLAGALLFLSTGCERAGTGSEDVSAPRHMEGVALDAPSIAGWASEVVSYEPGPEAEAYTDPAAAIGPASGVATEVLVLGRGGAVTLAFEEPIGDAEGAELAVFENGLGTVEELFAELAYLEISSNGDDFARFPVRTFRSEPVDAYERVDAREYSGFAGLHPKGTGTAFDFAELSDHPKVIEGTVDLTSIRYVRVVDVVGDGTERDSDGIRIYDPYPTTGTAGFDLDGVAFLEGTP